jgi:hypothetical protein
VQRVDGIEAGCFFRRIEAEKDPYPGGKEKGASYRQLSDLSANSWLRGRYYIPTLDPGGFEATSAGFSRAADNLINEKALCV